MKNSEIYLSTMAWYIINESIDEISFEFIITCIFIDIHTHTSMSVHGRCLYT